MVHQEKYMRRCLELARKGMGNVAPNPMVGAVIVHNGRIIGEGYHRQYGEAHAEVNAVRAVKNQELLKDATLYVNLEPCSHYGKTPPCAALIIEKQIPRVVIGNIDPFPQVCGGGIKMLRESGVEVTTGVLEQECSELNRRFFTFHREKRPYIILKWAQTADGFIDRLRDPSEKPAKISTPNTMMQVHKLRAQESAIMVGTNTALFDNPKLKTRHWHGNHPVRIAIDRSLKIPAHYHLLDGEVPTLIFTASPPPSPKEREYLTDESQAQAAPSVTPEYIAIDFSRNILPQILDELYRQKLLSLIVEGGRQLLQSFIDSGLYDEMQVEVSPVCFGEGVAAPEKKGR